MPIRPRPIFALSLLLLPSLACDDDNGGTGLDPDPEAPVATSLSITPAGASLDAIGDTVCLDAEVRDEKGDVMVSVAVSWSTLDPAVATADGDGLVTAAAVGTARIAASAGELADTAVVSVERAPAGIEVEPTALRLAQGDTARLSAVVVDANGAVIEDADVIWSGEVGPPPASTPPDSSPRAREAVRRGSRPPPAMRPIRSSSR